MLFLEKHTRLKLEEKKTEMTLNALIENLVIKMLLHCIFQISISIICLMLLQLLIYHEI